MTELDDACLETNDLPKKKKKKNHKKSKIVLGEKIKENKEKNSKFTEALILSPINVNS